MLVLVWGREVQVWHLRAPVRAMTWSLMHARGAAWAAPRVVARGITSMPTTSANSRVRGLSSTALLMRAWLMSYDLPRLVVVESHAIRGQRGSVVVAHCRGMCLAGADFADACVLEEVKRLA